MADPHKPQTALIRLARLLREEQSVISPHVADPAAEPWLGELAAAGPGTAGAPAEYAFVVEAVREGYLLHYELDGARVVRSPDSDLALLAGDYLYALGLERLAGLGDLDAVRELSDLISLAAQVHDETRQQAPADEGTALWLACATAIAAGTSEAHEDAKALLGKGSTDAAAALVAAAQAAAVGGGFDRQLSVTLAGLDLRVDHLSSLG